MIPLISDALHIVDTEGFDTSALKDSHYVHEADGITILSAQSDLADRIKLDVRSAKNVVVLLAPNAQVVGLSIRGDGHIIAVGQNTRLGGLTLHGSRNIITVGTGTSMIMSNIVRGLDTRLSIGSDCVGAGGTIRTSDDHTIFDAASGVPINRARDVRIGDRVYLGRNVRVNKGADVGDGVVVAPDSVVTGRLKAGGYYGGVPARLIKENVTWKARA